MAERAGVVVVGGGPAGSACALSLARRGIAVTIVERARFPRSKPCGEYLSGGAIAALDELGLGRELRLFACPLRGVRLVPPGMPALELPFAGEALSLDRKLLDAMLLGQALAAGAQLVQGRVEDLRFERGRVAGVVLGTKRASAPRCRPASWSEPTAAGRSSRASWAWCARCAARAALRWAATTAASAASTGSSKCTSARAPTSRSTLSTRRGPT